MSTNRCRQGLEESPLSRVRSVRGFTLLELIVVLVIAGILAATAIIRWPGKSINVAVQTDQVVQDIRYTQSLAMARATTGQRYRMTFSAASYNITDAGGTTIKSVPLGSGMSFTGSEFTGGYLAFDLLGRPYNGATLMTSSLSVGVTGGGQTRTITVTRATGAVQVS